MIPVSARPTRIPQSPTFKTRSCACAHPPLARSCSLYTHTHTLTRTCSPALIRTRAPCALMLKHAHHTTAHVRVLSEWVYDILGIRGICGNHDDRVAGDGRAGVLLTRSPSAMGRVHERTLTIYPVVFLPLQKHSIHCMLVMPSRVPPRTIEETCLCCSYNIKS